MPKSFRNKEIAKLLKEVSAALEVKKKDRFRIAAYNRSATAIEHATSEIKDLYDEGKLEEIPSVGKNIAAYLEELFEKGKVKHFEEVKKGLPPGMFAVLGIPGVGPKTAYKLAKELKFNDVEGLERLCRSHKVQQVEGLGPATEEEILRGIQEKRKQPERMLLSQADQFAQDILHLLKQPPKVLQAEAVGSIRRRVPTVGDFDIAVSSNDPREIISLLKNYPQVDRVTDSGEKKAALILKNGLRVDLMVQAPVRYGSLLQHLTGSKQHNIHLRKIAREKGLSLSEYGIRSVEEKGQQFSEDFLMECATEADFYQRLDLSYIPPELREDTGEIEAAQKGELPELVDPSMIRGDFHVHTNFPIEPSHDLGQDSMEEVIKTARKLNYQYLGLTDHSPAVTTHTDEEIKSLVRKRNFKIDQLKSSENYIEVLNCLEVDILADGKISMSDDILKQLDLVIAGVHSSHRQSKAVMTSRIMNALENPHVHILSHPTGRILLEREAYEADWRKIFQFCAKNHKALEINASPSRLDLPDFMLREAQKYGVKFVINSDAHQASAMEHLHYGVSVARRGWCKEEDIVNAWPIEKVMEYFKRRWYN